MEFMSNKMSIWPQRYGRKLTFYQGLKGLFKLGNIKLCYHYLQVCNLRHTVH